MQALALLSDHIYIQVYTPISYGTIHTKMDFLVEWRMSQHCTQVYVSKPRRTTKGYRDTMQPTVSGALHMRSFFGCVEGKLVPQSRMSSRALTAFTRPFVIPIPFPRAILAATQTCTLLRPNGISQRCPHTAQARATRCSRGCHRRAVRAGAAWAGLAEGRPCCLCAS